MSKSLKKLSKYTLNNNELKNLKGGRGGKIKNPTGGGSSGLPPVVANAMMFVKSPYFN